MSELGQLLALVHNAHDRLGTFHGEFRDWARPSASGGLVIHSDSPDAGHPRIHWRDAGPFAPPIVRVRRLWCHASGALRVEVLRDNRLVRFGVRRDGEWWVWDAIRGPMTSHNSNEIGTGLRTPPLLAPPLIEPVCLLPMLRLAPDGCGVRAGRAVVLARGYLRQQARAASAGDRSYELEFDSEHGTMLRHAVIEGGQCIQVNEALDVSYDDIIDHERFEFQTPSHEPVGPRPAIDGTLWRTSTGE